MQVLTTYSRLVMLASAVLVSLGVALLAARLPLIALMVIGAAGLFAVLTASRSLVLAVILMSGTVDLFTHAEVGPISSMGMLTVGYAVGSWGLWLIRPRWSNYRGSTLAPFALFLAWGFTSALLWYRPTVPGLQNLLVIAAFTGFAFLAASEVSGNPKLSRSFGTAMNLAIALAVVLFVVTNLLHVQPLSLGIAPRSFSLFALVGIAWCLAGWRRGSRRSLWIALALVALVGVSLSRTALVVGLFLFPLAQFKATSVRGWLKLVGGSIVAAVLLYVGVSHVEPLRARFFEGDTSLQIGGIAINAMGRTALWETTLDSIRTSPWIGQGAGSAAALVTAHFPGLDHPHNDYLRILHDYGMVGLVLWIIGYGRLLRATWRAWAGADRARLPGGRMHLAAFLSLTGVALAMLTDNVIVYAFVMVPVGALVGASLGLAAMPFEAIAAAERASTGRPGAMPAAPAPGPPGRAAAGEGAR